MKLFLATLNEPHESWEGEGFVARIRFLLGYSRHHCEVLDPDEADAVVFLESNRFKSRHDIDLFARTDLLRQFCHKSFTINYSAHPLPLLPGLYVSLPQGSYDVRWARAIPYPFPSPNPKLSGIEPLNDTPCVDVSFRGALSHPVRGILVEVLKKYPELGSCQIINRWFDHSFDEQVDYIHEISSSRFVLCPRGLATSSYRLYESIQIGSVPVVISDDWVPPDGIDWHACTLRVSEDRLNELPDLLKTAKHRWPAMKVEVSRVWHHKLRDEVLADTIFDQLDALFWLRRTPCNWNILLERWNSAAFRRENGWDYRTRFKRFKAKVLSNF